MGEKFIKQQSVIIGNPFIMIQIEVLKCSKKTPKTHCMENGDNFGILSYQTISQKNFVRGMHKLRVENVANKTNHV